MLAYNPKKGQLIKTDAPLTNVDRAFGAHYHIAAVDAVAADAAGIMPLTNLGAAVQAITTGLTNPAVPRNVQIDGNVSGITGNVKITGTNLAGEAIDETLALNGTTNVVGAKAFKTITKVDLPVQVHTPAAQTETQQITHKADAAGTITIAVTAAALGDASPKSVAVEVAQDDTAAEVAARIIAALNDDEDVSAAFAASVTGAGSDTVTLTAKTPLANDSTLAMEFTDTDTTGVTAGSSTNGTTGVPYDKVSVGWGDKFGLPYMLYADELVFIKLFGKSADTGTVTPDEDELEKNVFDPNGSPDGQNDIDLYIIV